MADRGCSDHVAILAVIWTLGSGCLSEDSGSA